MVAEFEITATVIKKIDPTSSFDGVFTVSKLIKSHQCNKLVYYLQCHIKLQNNGEIIVCTRTRLGRT